MQVSATALKPLSSVPLNPDEERIVKWIRSAVWEIQKDDRGNVTYKTKVPEFHGGVRMFRLQANAGGGAGGQGPLELFLKKLQFQGVVSKQNMYPLTGHGTARFLALTKADLDNLGVGKAVDEDY